MSVNSNGYIHLGGNIRNIYILLLLSLSFGTVTDYDGNGYSTRQFGDQLWMMANLKVTHYNNGDEIPTGYTNSLWGNLSTGAYAVYNDDPSNVIMYGNLYNWYAVDDDRSLCPEGWHIPSRQEYTVLTNYLIANNAGITATNVGSALAGNAYLWDDGDLENNSYFGTSYFYASPGGRRSYWDGTYFYMGYHGYFWTSSSYNSSSAKYQQLVYNSSSLLQDISGKQLGFSIRCLEDQITGCTNPEACNYDETANVDDGSCEFTSCDGTLLVPSEYSTIQSAIDAAVEGDSVLVSAGTYYENIVWSSTNGIKLIGSSEDDCIIDGNELASVIRFEEDLAGIIDSITLITGFTIQNGYAQGDNPYEDGGGMYVYESSPTLTNVTFSGNSANYGGGMYMRQSSPTLTNVTFSGNSANYGGGMYMRQSSPTLTDVTFSDNTANYAFSGNNNTDGGGMYLYESSPTLTDVTFSGNTANYGGGMYLWESSPTLTEVTFSGNTTGEGGGGMYLSSSSPNLTDVTFSGNTANEAGGGMSLWYSSNPTLTGVTFSNNSTYSEGGGMHLHGSSPTLTDVTFSGNTALFGIGGGMFLSSSSPTLTGVIFSNNTADSGGGMWLWYSSNPTLTGVTFSGNSASYGEGYGGGMWLDSSSPTLTGVTFSGNTALFGIGGGMFLSSSSPTLTGVIFSNNTAESGGGMWLDSSSPTLTGVTFSGNSASYGEGYGGGMWLDSSSPTLTNSILWSNSPEEICLASTSSITINYSDIQNGEAGIVTYDNGTVYWGDGNIDAYPLFTDPDNGDFTLQSTSPCIDAGDPESELDPDGTRADMGAYYFHQGEYIEGCTNPEACNYDETANADDGSCEYEVDCAGACGGDSVEDECGVCGGGNSSCSGCTDPEATNYNPEAIVSDGSCIYPNYFETIWDEMSTTIMAIYIESAELDGAPLDNGDEIGIFDGDACVGVARLDSPIDETYQIFVPADNPSTSEIDGYIAGNPIAFLYWDFSSQTVYSDVAISILEGPSTYQNFANTTVELALELVYGCNDMEACNYNPEANTNDGSCVYHDPYYCSCENEILDCTGECGGDAVMDDCDNCNGDCIEDDNGFVICGDSENNVFIADCAGACGGDAVEDECGVCGGDGAIYECGCADIADGECDCDGNWNDECGVCGGDNSICEGCTNVDACNYQEDAIVDDGSCAFPELGDMNCDYLLNVLDVVALVQEVLNDNGYYEYADINEDGFVNILDVVILVNWIIYGEPSPCDGLTEVELWGEYYDIGSTFSINLQNQELGSIPPEIGCLTNLTVLNLPSNQLTGEIPSEIGNLTNLTGLGLFDNQLSGEIPIEIGNLTNLTGLYLHEDQLTGEIPQAVCDLIESNNLEMDDILDGNNLINTCD